jgi:cytochrome P450
MMIAGQYIPGGVPPAEKLWELMQTTVSIATYAIMRDERYFSNANSFIPTRWIESERGGETCNKAAWIPFSHGLRNCAGKPYLLLKF